MGIVLRSKTLHLRKRVPTRYASVESRKAVWISLHTDSQTVALQKALTVWQHQIEAWEARLAGDTSDAESQFEAARNLAGMRSFRYLTADKVARLPQNEIIKRVEAVPMRKGKPDKIEAAALLGTVAEPPITVSRALELFWDLAKDRSFGKSDDQLRRWKNPRKKAVANFIEIVGNRPIAEISADDMLDFRQWWVDRITAENLTPNSANKDFIHLGDTLKTVNRMKRLGLVLPLSDLAIKDGEKRTRPPFSDTWIKSKLLAREALAALNTEARCIILGMVNTGYRPSEGAGLLPHHIKLAGSVPHIVITPEGKQLKNAPSRREIPLTGVSLEAFKECPDGFPTYRFKDRISDTVNKFMRENGLLETPSHTLYGLRHSFEDRMLAAGIDERIRRDLFGHALGRQRYGEGASLAHKLKLLQSIAF